MLHRFLLQLHAFSPEKGPEGKIAWILGECQRPGQRLSSARHLTPFLEGVEACFLCLVCCRRPEAGWSSCSRPRSQRLLCRQVSPSPRSYRRLSFWFEPGPTLDCSLQASGPFRKTNQTPVLRAGHSKRKVDAAPARACSFFATCHPGLEEVVAKELREAVPGIAAVQPGRAGVSFRYHRHE